MRNKRRGAALTASVMLTIGLTLSGCGSSQKDGAESGGETAPKAGANSLTVWAWDPAYNILALEEAEKIYQQNNPDFTLDIQEMTWEDIQTKLTTLAQSQQLDELPDIFLMQDNAFQKNLTNYPDLFTSLDDSGIDFSEYPEWIVNYSTLDGVHYGADFGSGTALTALRIDVLEEAGFTIEDFTDITWKEFIEKAKVVKEKTGKPLLSTVAGQSDLPVMMLQSAGASLFDDEGKPTIADNPALMQAAEVYMELINTGVMIEVNSWDEYIGSFVGGNVAGTMQGVWIVGSIQTAEDQAGKWMITNIPSLDGVAGATNYTANGGSAWAVTPKENQQLAKDFLAATFAGSTELYDNILPASGAMSTWIPATKSAVYEEPQPFFNEQPIYKVVGEYSEKVPSNNTGAYYYEARDAVSNAITKIVAGADTAEAFAEAQSTVEFAMN